MTVDWIDTLLGGNHEFNVPTLTVSSSEIGKLSGNGSVRWNAETGIRIQAVTDGREAVMTGSSNVSWGQLIDPATYCTFAGLTDDGWNFASVPEPRGGLTTSSNLPTVMWDLRVRSIILERQSTRRSGCSLRMLMEPDLPSWVRNTHTTVNSEAFGEQSAIRCNTLVFDCNIGRVSARRRTNEWFEVQLEISKSHSEDNIFKLRMAILMAFSFMCGRLYNIRGHEHISEFTRSRWLHRSITSSKISNMHKPIGIYVDYMKNAERLLGLAVNFFLTPIGEKVADFLCLCWDTVDNSFNTKLAVTSICLEGLLRVAAEHMGTSHTAQRTSEHEQFEIWLKSNPNGHSERFLKRLKGCVGDFKRLGANDILHDWVNRKVVGVTKEDIEAWKKIRNASAHGYVDRSDNRCKLQNQLYQHDRVENLINKIVLQLMGYTGDFIDYAHCGISSSPFPSYEL